MVLTEYITPSCIIPTLVAENKADALKELTHLLFEKKRMKKDLSLALDQIIAREGTESTGIGRGIAVPHARVPGMKNLACAVGRAPEGLDFLAIDRKPVQLIFLICYPPVAQTTYLNFVATVAKLLSNGESLDEVMGAKTPEKIHSVLKAASKSFTEQHEGKPGDSAVEDDPGIATVADTHADLILLARLQLCHEMLASARTGKVQIRKRMENLRSLVNPRVLRHFDRLMKGQPPGLVPVEGDTCQGCFMRLPSQFVQAVRQEPNHLHTCPSCARYIYVV
jgi:nitrogen PTS system EIIA component